MSVSVHAVSDPLKSIPSKLFLWSPSLQLVWCILSESEKPQLTKETPSPWAPQWEQFVSSSHKHCWCEVLQSQAFTALEIEELVYKNQSKVLHASKDNRSLLHYKGFQHMWMLILSEHISIVISHSKWLNFPLIHLICIINEYTKEQCTLLIKHWLGSHKTRFVSGPGFDLLSWPRLVTLPWNASASQADQ